MSQSNHLFLRVPEVDGDTVSKEDREGNSREVRGHGIAGARILSASREGTVIFPWPEWRWLPSCKKLRCLVENEDLVSVHLNPPLGQGILKEAFEDPPVFPHNLRVVAAGKSQVERSIGTGALPSLSAGEKVKELITLEVAGYPVVDVTSGLEARGFTCLLPTGLRWSHGSAGSSFSWYNSFSKGRRLS